MALTVKTVVKRPSGAQNRKKKSEINKKIYSLPKLDLFFRDVVSTEREKLNAGRRKCEVEHREEIHSENCEQIDNKSVSAEKSIDVVEKEFDTSKYSEISIAEVERNNNEISENKDVRVSDVALYAEAIVDNKLRLKILSIGPHQPQDGFTKDVQNRSFSAEYYMKKTIGGPKISREWLCYSKIYDGVYCEPC